MPTVAAPMLSGVSEQQPKDDGEGVEDLFSFLGDFNEEKKKPSHALKGADLLANMADMLTSEIDSMFGDDYKPPSSLVTSPVTLSTFNKTPAVAVAAEPRVRKLANNPLMKAAKDTVSPRSSFAKVLAFYFRRSCFPHLLPIAWFG